MSEVALLRIRELLINQREELKAARQLGQDASGRISNDELPVGIDRLYPDSYFTATLVPSADGGVSYVKVDWGPVGVGGDGRAVGIETKS